MLSTVTRSVVALCKNVAHRDNSKELSAEVMMLLSVSSAVSVGSGRWRWGEASVHLLASVTLLLATERRSLLLLAAVRFLVMILCGGVYIIYVCASDALGGVS